MPCSLKQTRLHPKPGEASKHLRYHDGFSHCKDAKRVIALAKASLYKLCVFAVNI